MAYGASLQRLMTDWSFLLMMSHVEFLAELPSFVFLTIISIIRTKLLKSKSSKPQTPTSTIIIRCHLTCSPCMRVWKHLVCQSLTQTRAHTLHKHTHVSIHRPAHLCPPPPPQVLQYTASVLLQLVLLGVGVVFSVWARRVRERGRQIKRRSEEEDVNGPQLLRAIVSMICSSLLLSLCLLACSSRSKDDKIWKPKEEKFSKCYNMLAFKNISTFFLNKTVSNGFMLMRYVEVVGQFVIAQISSFCESEIRD